MKWYYQRMSALLIRKLLLQIIGQLLDVGVPRKTLRFLLDEFDIHAEMTAKPLLYLQQRGQFLFGEHAHEGRGASAGRPGGSCNFG